MKDAFLITECSDCDRQVLLTHDLHEGELITRCIHCDRALPADLACAAGPVELLELGYVLPSEDNAHGGGGCRDGQCGVVQPDP